MGLFLTKELLAQAKNGMDYLKEHPDKNAYISFDTDRNRINYVVEKGNWWYGERNYVFWLDGDFAFEFNEDLFDGLNL